MKYWLFYFFRFLMGLIFFQIYFHLPKIKKKYLLKLNFFFLIWLQKFVVTIYLKKKYCQLFS